MNFSLKQILLTIGVGILVVLLVLGGLGFLIINSISGGKEVTQEGIAVINISGPITSGSSGGVLGRVGVGSRSVMKQINQAKDDKKVKAILLRVNSPGGSSAASDEIYRELKKFKATEKPIVVSMGDVAASGGYYISAPADQIYADPSTITGSIGVIMQFNNLQELYNKIGVKPVTFTSGPHKDMGSPSRELTSKEEKILQNMIDSVYQEFVDAVVEGRGLSEDKVRKLADGRIYTGRQAKKLGLVDKLGTFYDAVDKAANLAGMEGEPNLIYYNQSSPIKRLLSSASKLITYMFFDKKVGYNTNMNTEKSQLMYYKLLEQREANYLEGLQLQY
ncbi:signal peptide peptidase SppA [Selenihalanaerobacter shriftii]|uniref:Protease-4 n=1 Tax=Selenihalanaerobacter shriftii TaxID=142842 RepID=A0A1T4R7Y3_9FIRM|nr:signal peptide peptidase SppA [Selenihalanaerobacter shriftii]SKA12162.1 protease-4 [Selenihalanaerobacter shriftii]